MSAKKLNKDSSLDFIKIGSIGKPHGLRGAFFIFGREDLVEDIPEVFVQPHDKPKTGPFKVLSSYMSGGKPVATIEGISSPEQVKNLTKANLLVADALITVNDNVEYLWSDIIGRKVVREDQSEIGIVTDIYEISGLNAVNITIANETLQVDVPLNDQYFFMDFKRHDGVLKLKVPLDFLDGLWVKRIS